MTRPDSPGAAGGAPVPDGSRPSGASRVPGAPAGRAAPAGHEAAAPTLRDRAARYALLPLRVFLGVTFVYAGLDKLTDPAFPSASGSGSIGEVMRGVRDTSAIPGLVDLALLSPVGFAVLLALAEIAVGLAVLAGLLTRLAAAGGALISLSLWLTVSWQVTPYYYGNDLAYLMAWIPLILAGAPYCSLDSRIRSWRTAWSSERSRRSRRTA